MVLKSLFSRCFIVVVLALLPLYSISQNLLTNGDFESGGNGVGFSINGSGYSLIVPPFSGTTSPGNYAFVTNSQPLNTSNFIATGDHTSGSGLMMVVDGNTTGGQQRFWRAGSTGGGICGLSVGTTYTFSYWIRSVSTTVIDLSTQSDIGIQFNNVSSFSLISGSTVASLPALGWQKVVYNFVPSNSCVNIELWNNNTNPVGNDFAVDDFAVLAPPQPLSITSSVINSTCFGANNGSIVIYGIGGSSSYVSYSISGTLSQTNSTGIFTNLLPGTYSISVTDSNGNSVSQPGVFISEPNDLTVSSAVSICSGGSTTLSVSGSSSGYTWTASPADVSLTTPNNISPVVSPIQTTTYTVTSSTVSTSNLIYNGNFSQGNNGFTTNYQYLVTTTPVGSQGTYGIVSNSNSWFGGFSSCTDHTTTTGNMMVIDGSTSNSGNDKFWCQKVPVIPGQNYTFSYWVQTVATPNPANIEVLINGVSIGISLAPATTCGWVQKTYTWNSGSNTTAEICMYDRVITSGGNDFAIDDITFTTTTTCSLSKSVVVTVNQPLSAVLSCGVSTANSVSFTWNPVSGATNYAVVYNINGGPNINGGTTALTSFTVNSLTPNDSVLIKIIPGGTGSPACFTLSSITCVAISSCPTPVGSVTQQPSCLIPTGIIQVTSPLNTSPLPIPTDLFISEVTDEDVGALTYVEIYNGTGVPKNLANYKLRIYNNGNAFTSCEFPLTGTLNNNSVYVVSVGSVVNQGGVVPNLVVSSCAGVNNNDNIRLATSSNVEFDLWGRTDGVVFTPANLPGYTYRRLATAPHPTMTWNPADWTSLDPQDYSNVGQYVYQTAIYEYSINGTTYQSSTTFSGLAPGTYSLTVRDLVSGCVSNPVSLVVNPIPTVPAPVVISPVNYCLNATPSPLSATPLTGATLNWYGTSAIGGTASTTPTVPTTNSTGSITYYVSQTIGGCEGPRVGIVVNVAAAGPSLNLFCDGANSTPTSLYFDFSNVGQTNFTYSYTINGGTPITGTWVSPSHYVVTGLSPGQSVVFTISANGTSTCVTPMSVTCNTACTTSITPNFAPISPICSGGAVPVLLTTSPNGIVGTWTPSVISNTVSGSYVFTPTNSLNPCATNQTLAVTINSPITPSFTAVPPICSGTVLSPLPTTSNNGISGTWSPALNNTTTTTYLFTPNVGQCATTTSLVITVNPNVTPTFTSISPICSGATLSALPTSSNNGITGTWSPLLNNTTTTTYTFTPNNGQCALSTTLTITVNPPSVTPSFNAVSPICSGATISALPTTSINGITGIWSPSLNNTTTTTYTFTPNPGQCALTTSLQIVVNPNITPLFNTISPVCAGTILPALPTISNNGISGSWLPALNNTITTTYTFTPNAGQCATNASLTIAVNQPTIPLFNPISPVCFGATISSLPVTSTNGITGVWSPTLNNTLTATYTFTPNAGQCATNATSIITVIPQITPTVSVVSSCNSNTITVTSPIGSDYQYSVDGLAYQSTPIFNNLSVGSHTIIANQISSNCISNPVSFNVTSSSNDVVVNTPLPLQICDPNNDGFATFDLTQVINFITGGTPYIVTFHETETDANIDGTSILNPTNYPTINPGSQIIYIRVESAVTGCYTIVQLPLIVNPTPVATTPGDYHICDDNYDGFGIFNLTSLNSEVLGSLSSLTHSVTYYTSLGNAQTGTSAITSVTSFPNTIANSQPLWAVVTILATGCTDIVTFNVVVDPLPQATQPAYAPYSLCETSAFGIGFESFDLQGQVSSLLLGQTGMSVRFYPSLLDAQNNTGAITTPSYVNTAIYVQTLGIRITNDATGCFVVSTIDIRVNPLPTPIPLTGAFTLCDTDQNGQSVFDLCSLTTDIDPTGNYVVSYHETQTDAQQDLLPLGCNYQNIGSFIQFIWVRLEDATTGCVSVMQIELNVNASPIVPSLSSLVACDQDSNTQNGVTGFNLELQTPLILAAQSSPASNYVVTYYTTEALATSGTFNIIPTLNYQGSNNQTIWFRVENVATDCFAIGSFTLEVNAPLVFATPPALSVCDTDSQPNNQFTTFNLIANGIVLPPGHTATYYPSYAAAINNGTPIPAAQLTGYINTQPAVQTLGVLITTPEGCKSYTTLDIRVLPIPTPKTDPPVLEKCDDVQPAVGTELFDVTLNENYIRNNDPSVTFSYFTSLSDAEQNINAIATPTSFETGSGIIYIRVNNTYLSSTGYCHVIVEQEVIVNPLPIVNNLIYNLCEADTNQQEFFDLTSQIPALLGTTQVPSNFSVSFYETLAAAQLGTPSIGTPSAYLNTSNPQDVYVRVVNNATGCVTTSGVLTLRVEARAVATGPQTFQSCDEYNNPHDGVGQLDLSQFATAILGTQDPVQFVVTYHTSQADADAGVGAIIDFANYITQADSDVVYVRVTNSNTLTPCYDTTTINIYIERYPDPTIVTQGNVNVICVDFNTGVVIRPLLLEIDNPISGTFTYQWFDGTGVAIPGATNATYLVADADANGATRSYTVEMTSALGCVTMSTGFEVIQSGPAVITQGLGYTVTNAFADSQIVTVNVVGFGTYQYSLNDGPLQDSPVFTNVPLGVNTITVWDTEGGLENSCEALIIEEVQTIGYPHYFTPNGDGINDTWNIVGLDASAKIHIFDRFGKLIKQISPEGLGWDGTYNGQLLPSTDYWFTVFYQEQGTKEFKAHFSLKR